VSRHFRFLRDRPSATIVVGGRPVAVQRGASLLANLLSRPEMSAEIDFYCAIGQCFRCICLVDGTLQRSCMYVTSGGEHVELPDNLPQGAGNRGPGVDI